MKKLLLPICAMLLCMTACKKDNDGILRLEIEHYASDAKVHLDNNYAVWDNDDVVKVNGTNCTITVDNTTSTATIASVGEGNNGYKAVYPADWAGSDCATIAYPATQTYRTNSAGGQVIDAPMAAYAATGTDVLKFKNVGSILAVNVSGVSKVMKIEVVADGTTLINGTASIDFSGERPTLGNLTDGTSTTTLNCGGVTVPEGGSKTFYIAMPPVTAKLTIRVYDEDYRYSMSQNNSFAMAANNGYNVPFNTTGLTPEPYGTFFYVSATTKVKFAPGNLRCAVGGHYTEMDWSFCRPQYKYNPDNLGRLDGSGYYDYFGWSTDGSTDFIYGLSHQESSAAYSGNFKDWGDAVNAQGNLGAGWSTLSYDEWVYLFNTRSGATIGSNRDCRYVYAVVNDVKGIILFPNGDFTWPDGIAMPSTYNEGLSWGAAPRYTAEDWSSLESAGCVFLPAAGRRYGDNLQDEGVDGYYWTSTPFDNGNAKYVEIKEGGLWQWNINGQFNRSNGCSVRLVKKLTQN